MSFTQKEHNTVINAKITNYGRKQLAKGKLNFKYYAIGDSEIDYDTVEEKLIEKSKFKILKPLDEQHDLKSNLKKTKNSQTVLYELPEISVLEKEVVNITPQRGFFTETQRELETRVLDISSTGAAGITITDDIEILTDAQWVAFDINAFTSEDKFEIFKLNKITNTFELVATSSMDDSLSDNYGGQNYNPSTRGQFFDGYNVGFPNGFPIDYFNTNDGTTTGLIPNTVPQATATYVGQPTDLNVNFIGTTTFGASTSIPTRITQFFNDTGINIPLSAGFQQRIWTSVQQGDVIRVRVSGGGANTGWGTTLVTPELFEYRIAGSGSDWSTTIPENINLYSVNRDLAKVVGQAEILTPRVLTINNNYGVINSGDLLYIPKYNDYQLDKSDRDISYPERFMQHNWYRVIRKGNEPIDQGDLGLTSFFSDFEPIGNSFFRSSVTLYTTKNPNVNEYGGLNNPYQIGDIHLLRLRHIESSLDSQVSIGYSIDRTDGFNLLTGSRLNIPNDGQFIFENITTIKSGQEGSVYSITFTDLDPPTDPSFEFGIYTIGVEYELTGTTELLYINGFINEVYNNSSPDIVYTTTLVDGETYAGLFYLKQSLTTPVKNPANLIFNGSVIIRENGNPTNVVFSDTFTINITNGTNDYLIDTGFRYEFGGFTVPSTGAYEFVFSGNFNETGGEGIFEFKYYEVLTSQPIISSGDTVELDRDFSTVVDSYDGTTLTYYLYPSCDSIDTFYGSGDTTPYWDESNLNLTQQCVSPLDVPVWNMNLVYKDNIEGILNIQEFGDIQPLINTTPIVDITSFVYEDTLFTDFVEAYIGNNVTFSQDVTTIQVEYPSTANVDNVGSLGILYYDPSIPDYIRFKDELYVSNFIINVYESDGLGNIIGSPIGTYNLSIDSTEIKKFTYTPNTTNVIVEYTLTNPQPSADLVVRGSLRIDEVVLSTPSGNTNPIPHDFNRSNVYLGYKTLTNNFKNKAVGIIHYTNNTISNFYAENFYENTPELIIPNIMYHRLSTMGMTIICDTELKSFIINENKTKGFIRYYDMYVSGDPDKVVIGKCLIDHKVFLIEDAEVIASLSYKSNRNYTLPDPIVTVSSQGNSATSITNNNNQDILFSYMVVSDVNGGGIPYQNEIRIKLNDGEVCNGVVGNSTSLNVNISESFNFLNTNYFNDGLGYHANELYFLVQVVDSNQAPQTDKWKKIPISGYTSGNSLDPNLLESTTIKITGDMVNNASFLDIEQYIDLQNIGATNYLHFGDEEFFFGNVKTDIKSTVYESLFLCPVGLGEFQTSDNETWTSDLNYTYISEVGIYDDNNGLVATGKLPRPLKKKPEDKYLIYLTIDF